MLTSRMRGHLVTLISPAFIELSAIIGTFGQWFGEERCM